VPRPFGIYVHYPYCAHRCPYCDFAVSTAPPLQGRYTDALLRELDLRAAAFEGLELRSVYVGGGTPSLWDPAEAARLLRALRARFPSPAAAAPETTIEANPESLDRARLEAWRDAGVNRVSIGVQSFDPAVLAKLGRRHGREAAEEAIRAARSVLENVSVDLIYGARRSTVETARSDAARAGDLGVPHVSAYALTLDREVLAEEVPLGRMQREGRLPLPDDADVLRQARAIRGALRRAGLLRYEVSNHARPGFESVHNRLYWAGESYLGLGAGAYGFHPTAPGGETSAPAGGEAVAVRYGNHRDPGAYVAAIDGGLLPTAEEDVLGPHEVHEERVLLGLRMREGIPLAGVVEAEVAALVRARLAARRGDRLVLTSRGLDVHSAVAERLLP
jgi:putative oxygen-independent coproporphyrinogen III oxidase